MCAQGNTYFYLLFAFTSPLDCCRMKVIVILCDHDVAFIFKKWCYFFCSTRVLFWLVVPPNFDANEL